MHSYTIGDRDYYYLHSPYEQPEAEQIFICSLDHVAPLSVIGDNAKDFLQGQLSSDIRKVTESHYMPATLCNLKGRIKTIMDVVLCHDYQLILANDCIPSVLQDLKTIAMLSKVKLHKSERYSVIGIMGNPKDPLLPDYFHLNDNASTLLTSSSVIYRVRPLLYIALVEKKEAQSIFDRFEQKHLLLGSLAWHRCFIESGGFSIYPSTKDTLLPHKVSMENSDYLSFEKGCYKGQEVIARMHYKANIKHGLRTFLITSPKKPQLLQKLLDPKTNKEIGEIIDFYPASTGHYRIVCSGLKTFQGEPLLAI